MTGSVEPACRVAGDVHGRERPRYHQPAATTEVEMFWIAIDSASELAEPRIETAGTDQGKEE